MPAVNLTVPVGLAAAALAVPLALWYVLRSRRPRREVAATYLWARADRSVAAAVPWQRFRPDRTFWFVLLAILVGALALARPSVPAEAQLGDHTIVVVDVSGSMLADEGGRSRLDLARERARRLVDALGPGQSMSVVEAGARPRILVSAASDGRTLRGALDELRATPASGDLAGALTLAASLHRPGEVTTTTVLTDGVIDEQAREAAPADVRVEAVGSDRPNLAVTRVQAVPAGGSRADAFVQVRNFGRLAARARVQVAVGGEVAVTEEVTLAPRGTKDLVFTLAHRGVSVVEAAVEPVGPDPTGQPANDDLAADDRGWAVVSASGDVTALVAGPGNLFVAHALRAVEGVEVLTAPGVPGDLSGVDLLVVDRIPAAPQPPAPTLYIAPSVPPGGVTVGGVLEEPTLTFQDPAHELLDEVDLSGVAVATAQRTSAPELASLAGGPAGPLLLAGRLGGVPVAYLPFALADSTLPLEVAWPVLVANAVAWLTDAPAETPLVAGAEARLPVPPGARALRVRAPSGRDHDVEPQRPHVRVDEAGVWRVFADLPEGTVEGTPVAVNAPAEESDLARERPAPAREAREAREAGEDPAAVTARRGRRVVGRGLLAVVLLLLVVEWASSHGLRPLRGRLRRAGMRGPRAGGVPPRGRTGRLAVARRRGRAATP